MLSEFCDVVCQRASGQKEVLAVPVYRYRVTCTICFLSLTVFLQDTMVKILKGLSLVLKKNGEGKPSFLPPFFTHSPFLDSVHSYLEWEWNDISMTIFLEISRRFFIFEQNYMRIIMGLSMIRFSFCTHQDNRKTGKADLQTCPVWYDHQCDTFITGKTHNNKLAI